MIIEQKNGTAIKTSEQFKELNFGIKSCDMGLVLDILRSKMYSNPIGAICREVASNSRDANREAENNVPIEITINNSALSPSDLTITFKDNGPGISPERMADVFVNYGSSTKRESNAFTGGFGLGAKTPFSYADNFTIETIVDGIKYTYTAAIEEKSRGKIYMLDSQETLEPNGTSIIVPIKGDDRRNFERECYKATMFWPMKPVYKNFRTRYEEVNPVTIHEDDKFLIVKQNLLRNGYGLLLDGIFYEIDSNIMRFASYAVDSTLFIFKFAIGDLTISANRETLQYDDKTKTAINMRLVELVNFCKQQYEIEFKKNTTWLQAALFHKQNDENVYFNLANKQRQTGDPWFDTVSNHSGYKLNVRLDELFPSLQFFKCEIDVHSKVSRTKTNDVKGRLLEVPMYLFDDSPSYHSLKDATIFESNNLYMAIRLLEPKLLKWSTFAYKAKKGLVKQMKQSLKDIENLKKFGFSYNLYSTVQKMKAEKTPGEKQSVGSTRKPEMLKIFVRNIASSSGIYTYFKVSETGITTESGAPVDTANYTLVLVDDILKIPVAPFINSNEWSLLKIACTHDIVPKFQIAYANKKRGSRLLGKIQPLEEKLQLLTPDVISQVIDRHHVREILDNYAWLLTIPYKSKEFSTVAATLKAMNKPNDSIYISDCLLTAFAAHSKMKDLKAQFEKIKTTCPLLSVFSSSYARNNGPALTQYINLIEEDEIRQGRLTKI